MGVRTFCVDRAGGRASAPSGRRQRRIWSRPWQLAAVSLGPARCLAEHLIVSGLGQLTDLRLNALDETSPLPSSATAENTGASGSQ